ncbi:MAG: preprotein translocase subunit SecY [Planctomycetes bacterium]|nr:preprotein translocase subunit SecY [Planctomycetota bacterium]
MVEHIRNMLNIPELRKKLGVTLMLLIVYRVGSHIPIPGVNLAALKEFEKEMGTSAIGGVLSLYDTISGGAIGNLAIFSLGIMPYISASIIFSLLTKVVPSLEELSKEGHSGQQKINEWTRYATVPLCIVQSILIVNMIMGSRAGGGISLISPDVPKALFYTMAVVTLTGGALFLMWLGEQITEYGVGNGISLLIMAGIVTDLPNAVVLLVTPPGGSGESDSSGIPILVVILVLFVGVVMGVILMSQAQRRLPIQYAKHTRGRRVYGGQKAHLPIRINMAGVMPVIFASSLMIFPSTIGAMLGSDFIREMFRFGSFWYIAIYIGMIYFFSYFWTSLMFQPTEWANQMKEHGSFIPGIRAGKNTAQFLNDVMTRITFVGAAFLCVIALLPQMVIFLIRIIFQRGEDPGLGAWVGAQFLGGTGILIVVGVVLDLVQKLEGHLLMRHYTGFVKRGRIKGRMG